MTLWPNEDMHKKQLFHHILVLLVVFFLAVAASYEGYIEKMTFDAELKQYKTAKYMFELAISKRNEIKQKEEKKVITQEESLAKQREILIQLGKEALIENGDWVIMHRQRPLEFIMKG
jgi:predicted S18 family serine protease